jgi:branched-chain amino acid transport system ATP-binding protein
VQDISQWVVVMAQGSIIAEGPPESMGENQAVIDAYLGAHHDAPMTAEEEQAILAQAEAAIAAEEAVAESADGEVTTPVADLPGADPHGRPTTPETAEPPERT